MIDWWGPILFEFYSMTEGFGAASIFSDDWLRKPGSVGRPLMGVPHIAGPDGTELPAGEIGTIWFEGGSPSEYHGDPGKTAAAANELRLADRRGRRPPGRRRLSLSHRPGRQPDHLGRGEHLPAGDRERAHPAPVRDRRCGPRRS